MLKHLCFLQSTSLKYCSSISARDSDLWSSSFWRSVSISSSLVLVLVISFILLMVGVFYALKSEPVLIIHIIKSVYLVNSTTSFKPTKFSPTMIKLRTVWYNMCTMKKLEDLILKEVFFMKKYAHASYIQSSCYTFLTITLFFSRYDLVPLVFLGQSPGLHHRCSQ